MQVGDGTTSVVLLSAEMLRLARPYLEDGVHPHCVAAAFRHGLTLLVSHIDKMAVKVSVAPFLFILSIAESSIYTYDNIWCAYIGMLLAQ